MNRIPYELCHKEVNGIIYKLCNICGKWFISDLNNFHKNKCAPDGLFPYCKDCNKKKGSKDYKDNQEAHNKYQRESYKQDKHNMREKNRIWGKVRRERGEYLEWQHNNPDKIKQYSDNHKSHKISKKEWIECKEYFNNSCAYCGLPIEEHFIKVKGEIKLSDFHKEHLIHGAKNDLSNCVPSCKSCNSKKHTFTINKWYNKDNSIYSYERYHKIYLWIRFDYKKYRKIYIKKVG